MQTTTTPENLPSHIADVLIGDVLKNMNMSSESGFDEEAYVMSGAFRRDQFCRKIRSAQFGCITSITWAWQYYDAIVDEAQKMMAEHFEFKETICAQEKVRRDLIQHYAGQKFNVLYQAYIDTLNNPEEVESKNHLYMAWIGKRISEYQTSDKQKTYVNFVIDYAEQNLSSRVKAMRSEMSLHHVKFGTGSITNQTCQL